MTDGIARVIVGRYRLVGPLGQGGMGAVWQAHDTLLGRDVAIKEIWFPSAGNGPVDPADPLIRRALREAQAAARLRHPGIVTVHDVVTDEGRPWIVMELVNGRSLAEVIREHGLLTEQRTAEIGLQVLDALRSAHRAGIAHRDVKPANILLDDAGRVVLTDFGIAAIDDATALTATGQMVGSPAYLAPERIEGRPATAAADLWALGVTLYTAVTGRSPFHRDGTQATLAAILTSRPIAPAHAGRLWPVIKGLLVKDPARRLTTEQAMPLLVNVAYPTGSPGPALGRRRPGWWPILSRRDRSTMDEIPPTLTAPPPTLAAPTAHQAPYDSEPTRPPGTGVPATRPVASASQLRWSGPIAVLTAIAVLLVVAVVATRSFGWQRESDGGGAGQELPTPGSSSAGRSGAGSDRTLYSGALIGHTSTVLAVAFSPDGSVLASGASDRTVRIWDTATGRTVHMGAEHKDSVLSLAFSPDGRFLASGGHSDDRTVRLWQVGTWQAHERLDPAVGSVQVVAFSPDGNTLAAGGLAGPVVLWDARTLTERARLPGHRGGTLDVTFSPDGRTLASTGFDGTVRVWDAGTGSPVTALAKAGSSNAVAFSPDGRTLATGADDSVRRWDTVDWRPLESFGGGDGLIETLAFSPDGGWLIAGTESDLGVPVWEVGTGRLVRRVKVDDAWPMCARFSFDGGTVAVGTDEHLVRMWPTTSFVGG